MMLGQSNNIPVNWVRMRQERSTAALLMFSFLECGDGLLWLGQILLRCATLDEPLRLLPPSHMYEFNCKCPQVALKEASQCLSFFPI